MRGSPERRYMMVVDCVRGGEGRGVCGHVVRGLFFFFAGRSDVPALCLQLEAHAHFVSAGVEVLPVDQG